MPDRSVFNIVIVSDQPVLLRGLAHVLERSGFHAAAWEPDSDPPPPADLILLDITAGLTFGQLTGLHRRLPHAPVVLWADALPLDMVLKTLEFGVRGIVERTARPEQLTDAMRRVASGEMQIGFGGSGDGHPLRRQAALTPRESEIVEWLRMGLRNKEIANRMSITEGTVKIYLFRLFHKMGVKSRFELARSGACEGFPSPLRGFTVLAGGALRRPMPS